MLELFDTMPRKFLRSEAKKKEIKQEMEILKEQIKLSQDNNRKIIFDASFLNNDKKQINKINTRMGAKNKKNI